MTNLFETAQRPQENDENFELSVEAQNESISRQIDDYIKILTREIGDISDLSQVKKLNEAVDNFKKEIGNIRDGLYAEGSERLNSRLEEILKGTEVDNLVNPSLLNESKTFEAERDLAREFLVDPMHSGREAINYKDRQHPLQGELSGPFIIDYRDEIGNIDFNAEKNGLALKGLYKYNSDNSPKTYKIVEPGGKNYFIRFFPYQPWAKDFAGQGAGHFYRLGQNPKFETFPAHGSVIQEVKKDDTEEIKKSEEQGGALELNKEVSEELNVKNQELRQKIEEKYSEFVSIPDNEREQILINISAQIREKVNIAKGQKQVQIKSDVIEANMQRLDEEEKKEPNNLSTIFEFYSQELQSLNIESGAKMEKVQQIVEPLAISNEPKIGKSEKAPEIKTTEEGLISKLFIFILKKVKEKKQLKKEEKAQNIQTKSEELPIKADIVEFKVAFSSLEVLCDQVIGETLSGNELLNQNSNLNQSQILAPDIENEFVLRKSALNIKATLQSFKPLFAEELNTN